MKLLSYSAIVLILLQGCGKKDEKCPEVFLLPVNVSPLKPVYKIGDTIEIVSRFHYMLPGYHQDDATRQRKKVGDFDMRGITWRPSAKVIRIDSIFSNPLFSVVGTDFTFLQQTPNFNLFQYSESGVGLVGEYDYSRDTFNLSFKVICNTSGTFLLGIGSDNTLRYAQPFEGWCKRLRYYTFYKMNENQDNNNIHFLSESPHSHWNEWTLLKPQERFHDSGGYCFKVEPR